MACSAPEASVVSTANPMWISTHWPGAGGSSSRPMFTRRATPSTSTSASWSPKPGTISTTRPGMPRHISDHLRQADLGGDQIPHHRRSGLDGGLDGRGEADAVAGVDHLAADEHRALGEPAAEPGECRQDARGVHAVGVDRPPGADVLRSDAEDVDPAGPA